jgi:hypothetical protein
MRAQAAGLAERHPQRSRLLVQAGLSPRGEVIAALAVAALLTQLLFAQLTLVFAVSLTLTGRLTRWRPQWLTVPGVIGLAWVLSNVRAAVAGFLAVPRALAPALAAGPGAEELAHKALALSGTAGQRPLALLAGTGEAWLLLWLGWRRMGAEPNRGWRPGLIAFIRRRVNVSTLAAGRTVTTDGCAIGVEPATGRLARVSWTESERGLLVCGAHPAALAELCLPAVAAALRRRMAVLIIDLTGSGQVARLVAELCGSLGVRVAALESLSPAARASALGQAIRRRETVLVPAASGAVADLASVLTRLSDLRLRGDTLAWIHGCEAADAVRLSALLALGPATGTRIVLSTASEAASAALATTVAVTVTAGPVGEDLAVPLAGQIAGQADAAMRGSGGTAWPGVPGQPGGSPFRSVTASRGPAVQALIAQPAGTFAVIARARSRQLTPGCIAVPMRGASP